MTNKNIILKTILFVLTLGLSFVAGAGTPYNCVVKKSDKVATGLIYQQYYCDIDNNKDVVVNVLNVNASKYSLIPIVTSLAKEKKFENVMDIAKKSPDRNKILAGVNGGFFDMATKEKPIDNICNDQGSNAEFKSYPQYGTGDATLVINNHEFSHTCQSSRPALAFSKAQGYQVININFGESVPPNYNYAIGAGPILVKDGNISKEFEGNFPWINDYASRTAVGFNRAYSTFYIVAVDSKNTKTKSMGMTIPQLANYMKNNLNTYNAMNLDGGGSTTMCIEKGCKKLVNTPGDVGSVPRLVYNGLYVELK